MSFIEKIFGDLNKREVKKVNRIVEKVVALEEEAAGLSDEELKAKTPEFKERLKNGETLDDKTAFIFESIIRIRLNGY